MKAVFPAPIVNERPHVLLGVDEASPESRAIEKELRARCHTRTVQSLGEALAAVKEQAFDAVVVTERAFRDHGLDLLAMVASTCPGTLRLLLAREPDSNLLRRAIHEAGVQRVFFAPLSASRIADAVNQLATPIPQEEPIEQDDPDAITLVDHAFTVERPWTTLRKPTEAIRNGVPSVVLMVALLAHPLDRNQRRIVGAVLRTRADQFWIHIEDRRIVAVIRGIVPAEAETIGQMLQSLLIESADASLIAALGTTELAARADLAHAGQDLENELRARAPEKAPRN